MAQTGQETDRYNTFVEYTDSNGVNGWCANYEGGCTYRGRGAIQLTHRSNYARAGTALGQDFVANPNLVADPRFAFETAGWYWQNRNLNDCSDRSDVTGCTRLINGGTNGLSARQNLYVSAQSCIGGSRALEDEVQSLPTKKLRKNNADGKRPINNSC